MTYDVEWTRKALRDLRRLDNPMVSRITVAVGAYAESGQGDVKRLTNTGGEYRLRVGHWRVRFRLIHGEVHIMLVLSVLPRGDAYKR